MTSCPTPVGQQAGVVLLISFVYTRSARRFVYTRSNRRSVYTRSNRCFVYTRGWCILTHTSVRGAASAWAADIHPSSDCDGACVTAVVRAVVWEMTLAVAGWYRLSPILQEAGLGNLKRQLLVGRLLSQPVCQGGGRTAAVGKQFQASLLYCSFPSLSCRTSH